MTVTGSITALPGVIDGFVIAPQSDSTPAADPFVQQLVAENAALKEERDRAVAERDQLAAINARITRRLATLRDGVEVLAERIKERE